MHIKLLSFLNKYMQTTVSWPQFTTNFTSGWTFSYEFLVTHVTLLVQYFVYMEQLNTTIGRHKSISFPQVDIPSWSSLGKFGKSSKTVFFVVRLTIRIDPLCLLPLGQLFVIFLLCVWLQESPILPYYLPLLDDRYNRDVKGMRNAFLRPVTKKDKICFEYQSIRVKKWIKIFTFA